MQEDQWYKATKAPESATQRCAQPRLRPSPHPHGGLPSGEAGDALLREGKAEGLGRDRASKLGKRITFRCRRQVPAADRGGCARFAEI